MTAVIVGHDGAGWLSHGIDALHAQTRQVQRIVAVDTGSRDRSGTVLTSKLGQAAVFGMDRATGYAVAVRRALQHKTATAPLPSPPGGASRGRQDQTEWIWLLHDDCEPAPDALEQLLRGAAETPTAAVLGPKLMDWTDRDVVLETGISVDTVGRRVTGIEAHEVDQGQHDGDRDVLAVSSAGMLVRRDVWDQVGGFDPGMALFGEDIDLCWRVHAAGFRVRVITDAVVFHALAATRGRRPISVGRRARLLDRRNGLLTLLGNLPAGPMLVSLLANLAISLVRTVFYTVAKRGTAALDEAAAVLGIVGQPLRLAAARRRRARGRRAAYSRVRADLQPGHSLRRAAEFLALLVTRSGKSEPASGRSAIDDPTEDDSLLTDTGFLQRFVTRPGVLLTAGLIVVAVVGEHSLFGGGPLGGGALVPAWEGASSLWGQVLGAFHPVGIGSASAAPPAAGFVALLASVLLGKTWLAVDVLLLGCVPLAGFTALLALRKVTRSSAVRVWAAASYALLPVAFGAVSAGRLGSAVAFVLIPLIGLAAGRMFTESPRLARRAAWAAGLIVMIGTAFVPVLWPMAVLAAAIATVLVRRSAAMLVNLLIVAATPLVLLLPWMLHLLAHPSLLLLEAGVQQPGLATANLPARALLLLSPGGPGLPPYWVSAALGLIALAALAAPRHRALVMAGWGAALLGLATAVVMSRSTVTAPGGQAITPWPGPALAVAAAGLVLAGAAAADGLGRVLGSRGRTGLRRFTGARGLPVAVLGLAAVSAPVLAAAYWLMHPVTGPVAPAAGEIVPSLAPISGSPGRQLRTLVLSSSGGHVSYLLLRGNSPQFADPDLTPVGTAQDALSNAVASLVAPAGGLAASQSQQLARFDIGFVLVQTPASPQLVSTLNGVAGLSFVSRASGYDLWKLATLPARVSVVEPSGAVVAVNSGPIGASGTAPAAGGILELAEPSGGWHAALNGHALTPVRSPAGSWAQAFRLPPGGGTVTISRSALLHDLVTGIELLAIVVVAVLALPGVRTAAELEAAATARAELATEAEAAAETARTAPARPGSPGKQSQPGKPGRSGRGRAAPARGKTRAGRRKPAPAATDSAAAEPAGRAGGGHSLRGAAGRAAALRPGRRQGSVVDAAAAGAAAAEVAAAGLAGAAAGRAAGTGSGAASSSPAASSPGASSTGGQSASRFLGGSPARRPSRPDGDPASRPQDDRPAARWDTNQDSRRPLPRPGLSPSGSGFDDLSAGPDPLPSGRYDRHLDDSGTGRRPARRRRGGDPGRREQQPGRRRDERPSDSPRPVLGRSPSGSPYPDEPEYPARDADRRPEPGPDRRPDRHRSGSGWHTAERSPWGADEDLASAWPEPRREDGWPQAEQLGWPQERRTGPGWRGDPGQAQWSDEPAELEALPQAGEVHHDWPSRTERRTRGWITPGEDADGESW